VHIIARSTLKNFCEKCKGQKDYKALKSALDAWYAEVKIAHWKNSQEVKKRYASASIISAERVVFNIKGNAYRLVAAVRFDVEVVYIKWIGTHSDYDNIEAKEIEYGH
jgi:mRNA interferase HigB